VAEISALLGLTLIEFLCEGGDQAIQTSRKNRQNYDRNVYPLLALGHSRCTGKART